MKYVIILCASLLFCVNTFAQKSEAKKFALQAFQELKNDNAAWFANKLPDSLDMVALFDEIAGQLKAEERKEMREMMNGEFISKSLEEMPERLQRSFRQSRGQVNNWSVIDVHADKMEIKAVEFPGKDDRIISLENSFEISLPFEDADYEYEFVMEGVRKSERNKSFLLFNNRIKLRSIPKYAEIEEIAETVEIAESTKEYEISDRREEDVYIPPPSKKEVIDNADFNEPVISQPSPRAAVPDRAETIYEFVEQSPSFPGGEEKMMAYLQKNLQYPATALDQGIAGMVYINFIVEKDGALSMVKVVRNLSADCDTEAKRLVESMPNWIAGKQNGMKVRCRYTLPVEFFVED